MLDSLKNKDYTEVLLAEAKGLINYMESKGAITPALKENGLLMSKEDAHAQDNIGNYQSKDGIEVQSPVRNQFRELQLKSESF